MGKATDDRRAKRFVLSPECLLSLLGFDGQQRRNYGVTAEGLPAGYEIVHVNFSAVERAFVFIVVHDSFPPVALGEIIPLIDVKFTSHQDQPKESLYKRKSLI